MMTTDKAADRLGKRLSSIIEAAIRNKEIGGANLLVVRHGHDVVDLAAGTARTDGTPYARDTILRLYSQTKPITATAAMILVERGLLDLDTPVADILPEFAAQRVLRAEAGTVESGLPEQTAETAAAGGGPDQNVSRETSSMGPAAGTEPVASTLTIRHLLTMTSGLTYPGSSGSRV